MGMRGSSMKGLVYLQGFIKGKLQYLVSGDSSGMPMERYEQEYGWQLLLRE